MGLTSITVGIETPNDETLAALSPRADQATTGSASSSSLCRGLGIRTVAGFLIGFPEDTEQSIRARARLRASGRSRRSPISTWSRPIPGTEFFEQIKDQIADFDFSHYTSTRRC